MPVAAVRNEYVQAFERGLAVIMAFEGSPLTLSEVAARVGMPPAAARRYLSTLTSLGYFTQRLGRFAPTAKVVELSAPYFAASGTLMRAQAALQDLTLRVDETTTLTHLHHGAVMNVLDVQTPHELAIQVQRGRLLPAYCTAMGRAMLSLLPPGEAERMLRGMDRTPHTVHTRTDIDEILGLVQLAREDGFAVVEEEHTPGIRTMSMAFRYPSGQLAAFSVPAPTAREGLDTYIQRVKAPLLQAVESMGDQQAGTASTP